MLLSTSSNENVSLLLFGGKEIPKSHPWIAAILLVNRVEPKDLEVLCREIIKSFLNEPINHDEMKKLLTKYGKETFRKLTRGAMLCYANSGKQPLTSEELEKDLKTVGIMEEKLKVIKDIWSRHRNEVLENLKSSSLLPTIDYFSWSLDRRLATDRTYEVLETIITLHFGIGKGKRVNDFFVELTPAAFMEFLEELREIESLLKKRDLWGF